MSLSVIRGQKSTADSCLIFYRFFGDNIPTANSWNLGVLVSCRRTRTVKVRIALSRPCKAGQTDNGQLSPIFTRKISGKK